MSREFAKSEDTILVGRWMSAEEYQKMVESGQVQESYSGTTHVAYPANPDAYVSQAEPGSYYVEFDVPVTAVKRTQRGWAKIVGPQSLEGRLAKKKGLCVPQMPAATHIVHKATK